MVELWLLGDKDQHISPLYAMPSKEFGGNGREKYIKRIQVSDNRS